MCKGSYAAVTQIQLYKATKLFMYNEICIHTHTLLSFFEVLKVYLLVLLYFNNLPCNRILSWIEAQNNLEGKEDSQ